MNVDLKWTKCLNDKIKKKKTQRKKKTNIWALWPNIPRPLTKTNTYIFLFFFALKIEWLGISF